MRAIDEKSGPLSDHDMGQRTGMSSGSSKELAKDPTLDAILTEQNLVRAARRQVVLAAEARALASNRATSEPADDMSSPAIAFSAYTDVQRLHSGGQGVVYRARQRST